ncbi:MAG: hypothetical protein ACFE95_16440 [Candidatus Hodarchaeota archaeon]
MDFPAKIKQSTIKSLTPSTQAVLSALHEEGPLNAAQLQELTGYSMRTIRYSLKDLLTRELVSKRVNLNDMRITEYQLILTASPAREETRTLRVKAESLKANMAVRSVK